MSSSAGRVMPLPKGEYNSATTYYILDAVHYQGSMYIARKTTVGNVPQEGEYWMLAVSGGKWGDITGTLTDQIDLKNALDAKQATLTFDATPTDESSNPVTSDGIYTALATKQATLTFDATPTDESSNPVTSNGIYDALAGKQDTLTFDNSPTSASTNPVTSDGIYTSVSSKADLSNIATVETGSTASQNYAVGDFVCVSGTLYKVSAAITSGQSFTVGTNITATNVGSELSSLNSNIKSLNISGTTNNDGGISTGLSGNYTPISAKLDGYTRALFYYAQPSDLWSITCFGVSGGLLELKRNQNISGTIYYV